LLSTNAIKNDILYVTSTCDYIFRTNFDFAIANEELAIISAAVRAFVEDACILSKSLETLGHVRFAKQREWAKQLKKQMKN
jgi:hypothetical protein